MIGTVGADNSIFFTRWTDHSVVSRYRSIAMFLGLGALWGGTFPAVEVGLRYFPPVLFAAARYDFAAIVLLGVAVVTADHWRPRNRVDIYAVLASGTFLIAGNSLLFIGQQYTTGGVAAIIYSLIPILTTAFAWRLLPGERLTVVGLVGILAGFLGVVVIAQPDPANLLAPGIVGKGYVLLATISVALGSVLVRRSETTMADVPFVAWSMVVGAILLHALSVAIGESPASVEYAFEGLVMLVYIAVFSTAVAFLLYFHLLGKYGPLETNLVSYVVPVVATVLGWAYLDEPVTVWTVAGFVLILAGFVLLKRRALREELAKV